MSEWIRVKDETPYFGDDLQITYDNGQTFEDGVTYLRERKCMMAGIAGGNGYFGEGFATNGDKCDYGLILDEPTHWRIK